MGEALAERCADLPDTLAGAELAIELGRYLVGESGVYLTRIVDRKESRGETFLVVDGGLHHQLAASGNFGTVVRRNYPLAIATRSDSEPVEGGQYSRLPVHPARPARRARALAEGDVGDLVAVFCAGAYGASASPAAFLGHRPAAEMLV